MADDEVKISIRAKDEVSAPVESVRKKFKETSQDVQTFGEAMAEAFARPQDDLSGLKGTMDQWVNTLDAATPANQEYAVRMMDITEAYKAGKIGADEASTKIKSLRDEMEQGSKSSKSFANRINDMANGAIGAVESLTGLNIAQLSVTGAIVGAINAAKNAIEEYSAYTEQIDKMAASTGLATEEISRIVQVADDFRVEASTVETAMKMMLQNGVAPSIEKLAELSDVYLSIRNPAQRAAEMQKIFGRSWMEMVPLLERGGAAIREASAGVADSLIVTDAAKIKAREYAKALDDWNDAITEVKYSFASGVLPTLTEYLNKVNDHNARIKEAKEGWMAWVPVIGGVYSAIQGVIGLTQQHTDAVAENTAVTDSQLQMQYDMAAAGYPVAGMIDVEKNAIEGLSRAQQENINKSLEQVSAMSQIPPQARAAGEAAREAARMAAAGAREAAKADDLAREAQDKLMASQKSWMEQTGSKMGGLFERLGKNTEAYYKALSIVDKMMGTNLETTARQQEEVEKLVAAYDPTKPEEFEKQMQILIDKYSPLGEKTDEAKKKTDDLAGVFEKTDKKAGEAKGGVDEMAKKLGEVNTVLDTSGAKVDTYAGKLANLKAKLDAMENVTVDINVTYTSNAPDGGGDNKCFIAGTPVLTPDGERAIETLTPGDTVTLLTAAGQLVPVSIIQLLGTVRSDLVTVYLSNGRQFTGAPNHPIMTPAGWVVAANLTPGMELVGIEPVIVERVEAYPGSHRVYNFEVDHSEHTFLVAGVTVHNAKKDEGIAGFAPTTASNSGSGTNNYYTTVNVNGAGNPIDVANEVGRMLKRTYSSGGWSAGG